MELIRNAVQWVLDLGASAMLPIILTVFGLILGQGFKKSFRAGLTVGVGFVGVNLVIGLLSDSVGVAAQQMITNMGLKLDVLDVGWPIGAALTWAAPVAIVLIPTLFIFNIALLALNWTKTMDVDIWNYWHLIFPGAIVYVATESLWLTIFCALIHAFIVFKLADWTAPAVEHYLGLPGVCLPHGETVNWAPITYALNKIEDKIPGFNKIDIDAGNLKDKIGMIGEPMMIGLILGLVIGVLANMGQPEVTMSILAQRAINLGVQMAAVMVILPRMVALLMEGLMPISEGARDFVQKRFPGKEVYIGLDAAVATGHPAVITVALIGIPLCILFAAILPYNRMLPFADLAVLPFTVIWFVVAAKGNVFRSVINLCIGLAIIFFIGTNLAELTTAMAHSVGFAFPENATMISGIDMSCHLILWMIVKFLDPSNVPQFAAGVIAAVVYFGLWFWCRNDIKNEYGIPVEKKAKK